MSSGGCSRPSSSWRWSRSFVFSLLYLTPGDPAAVIAGDVATTDDIAAHPRASSVSTSRSWCSSAAGSGALLHGDLGTSIFTNLPVTQLIGQRVEPTLSLTLCTLVVAVAGRGAARRDRRLASVGTWIDRAVMGFSVLGFSVPVFVLAYLLILAFAIELDWLPVQGYRRSREGFWPWLRHLILPSIALGTRLHRADRAHHARDHARRAGAGLHPHRAGQGPRAAARC